MKSTIPLNFILLLPISSCSTNKKQPPPSYAPKVVEAHGYVVPAVVFLAPKVFPVENPKLVIAKKPKVVAVNSNVVPAAASSYQQDSRETTSF